MSLNLKHMTANIYEYESHFYSGRHTSVYQKIFFTQMFTNTNTSSDTDRLCVLHGDLTLQKKSGGWLGAPAGCSSQAHPRESRVRARFARLSIHGCIIKHGRTNCHGTHPLRSTLKSRTSASALSIHIHHRVPYATPRTQTSITASSRETSGRCEGGCRLTSR